MKTNYTERIRLQIQLNSLESTIDSECKHRKRNIEIIEAHLEKGIHKKRSYFKIQIHLFFFSYLSISGRHFKIPEEDGKTRSFGCSSTKFALRTNWFQDGDDGDKNSYYMVLGHRVFKKLC